MRTRRRFAQHFLEPAWVAKVVSAIQPAATDAMVEIGPGRGALTRPLAASAGALLAIEVDRDLAAALARESLPRVTIVEGDVRRQDLAVLVSRWQGHPLGPASPIRVVGNLPYNISSPILFLLIGLAARTGGVVDATLMLQREVADRLVAAAGTRDYGVLSILTARWADATRVLSLPPGAFRPAPRVHSAVVRLRFRAPVHAVADEDALVAMVRAMFTKRRKTLLNALAPYAATRGVPAGAALAAAGIEPGRRPETLEAAEVARLAKALVRPGS